jgi:hypothetical protein
MKRYLFILLIAFTTILCIHAQVYPVRTITTVSPPYPTSLEQYANVEDGHISVTLIPNDAALQNYPVRLRLVINGGYYKIYTNPSFVHKSIVLNNGESLSLSGPELAEWFNPDNLIFEGYTKNQYQKTGRLPEGMYQIWFEVYDFYRDINISGSTKELKATVWTFENDPPMLNFPANEKEVPATDPQNIILNWTQRQAPFSSAGVGNQFKLEVWEVIPDDMNIEEAVRTTRPIYSGNVQTTTFNYSADQPILFPGKKYAWRVQVYDPSGKNRYKNDGYSEVRWFRFGKDCTTPVPMLDKIYFTAANLKWENDIRFDKYELRWKNKDIANSNWYTKDATGQGAAIDKLEQNTSYYVQMRGFCGAQEGEFSESLTIHTKQDASFACGGAPGTLDSANNVPLAALKEGEIFKAYDFDIQTYKVSGGNGNFSGKGFALVPLLKSIKFEVEFSGITVNSKRRMTQGEVKFIYNEKNGLVVNVGQLITAITGSDKKEKNPYDDAADKKITISSPVASINVSATGDVTVVTEDGHKQTVRASSENADLVYVGDGGDDSQQSVVDTKNKTVYTGTPEKSSSGSGSISQPTSKNEPVKYAVTFLPHAITTLTTLGGMDYPTSSAPTGNYNLATIGSSQLMVPWKSVESNKIDRLVAAIDGPADSIHFMTKNLNMVMSAPGDKSAVTPNAPDYKGSSFKQLLVTGVDDEDEIKAWYPEYEKVNDTTTRQNRILAGQVNIAAYDKINLDVCLVEVNGATVPNTLPIEQELNKIYASSLVQWKVTQLNNVNINLTTLKNGKFDSDHPGSMKYNDCENEVIDAFKSRKDYKRNTLYLFFIGGEKFPTTNKETKGYMQFNRNFGFIFRDNQDLNELIRTMAHELGHGAFRLRHVFSPDCPYPQTQGQTQNLMDYVSQDKATTALLLHKYQWKEVHDWDLGVNWFESGDEGKMVTVSNIELINKFRNDDNTFTFISMSGKPITLPANVTSVTFSTGDDVNLTDCEDKFRIEPFGTLKRFVIGEVAYGYCAVCNTDAFSGYFKLGNGCTSESKYIDIYSNSKFKNAITGMPCVTDGAVTFRVMLLRNYFESFNFGSLGNNYNGSGTLKEYDFLLYKFKSVWDEDLVYMPAKFDPEFDADVIKFLSSEDCECKNNDFSSVAYGFVYATQLQKNKSFLGCFKTGVPLLFYDKNINSTKLSYVVVQNWILHNINGFNTLKNDIKKFKSLKTEFPKHEDLYNFLKKYTPEEISKSDATSYKLRFGTLYWESGLVLDKIQNISKNELSQQMDDVFCLWENIPIKDRIYAINMIADKNAGFDASEEILLNLLIFEPDKKALIDELKSGKYQLFWKVWKVMDKEQRAIFITFLNHTLIDETFQKTGETNYQNFLKDCVNSIPGCDNNTPYKVLPFYRANIFNAVKFEFSLAPGGATYELDYKLKTSQVEDKGKIHVLANINYIDFSHIKDYYRYFIEGGKDIFDTDLDPFEPITLMIKEDIKLNGEIKLREGQTITVPVIYLYWLNEEIGTEQVLVSLRIVADGLIVGSIIATGGATTPLLALDLVVFGTDLVVQVLNETEEVDPQFMEAWDKLYTIYNIALLPRAALSGAEFIASGSKTLFTFVRNVDNSARFTRLIVNTKFIDDFLLNYRGLSLTKQAEIATKIDNLIVSLKSLKGVDAAITNQLYRGLVELRVKMNFVSSSQNLSLALQASNTSFSPYLIASSGSISNSLGKITAVAANNYVLSEQILWLPKGTTSFSVVGSLQKVSYVVNETTIVGDLNIVKSGGKLYLNPKTWLSDYPNLLAKIDNSYPTGNTLRQTFINDFANASISDKQLLNTKPELVESWENLKPYHPNLAKDPTALETFNKLRNNPSLNKMGLTDEDIAKLQYYGTSTRQASYVEILEDLNTFGNFLENNPGTTIQNFDKIISILQRTDDIGNAYKQGIHWMIRDLNINGSAFAGKTIKFEHSIPNARPTTANSSIDLFCVNCSPANLKIEYKCGPNSITSSTIKEQFIERDLFNANSLEEIQWRMEGTEFTKEKLVQWMKDNKSSIENLGYDKVKSFYPNDEYMNTTNYVDRFINKFNSETTFNSIFK